MNINSKRTAAFSLCCRCLTRVLQAAAAACIAGKAGIHDAVRSGDLALVKDHVTVDETCVNSLDAMYNSTPLLKDEFILNYFVLFSKRTPLHLSAENGHLEMSRLLVSLKADINAKNIRY